MKDDAWIIPGQDFPDCILEHGNKRGVREIVDEIKHLDNIINGGFVVVHGVVLSGRSVFFYTDGAGGFSHFKNKLYCSFSGLAAYCVAIGGEAQNLVEFGFPAVNPVEIGVGFLAVEGYIKINIAAVGALVGACY